MRNEGVPKIWNGLCENAWIPWQPIADLRMRVCHKSTHISAVTYPRLLNLIPNYSLDIGLLSPSCICNHLICIFINIYENIKNVIHEWGYMYKMNYISAAFSQRLLKFVLNKAKT